MTQIYCLAEFHDIELATKIKKRPPCRCQMMTGSAGKEDAGLKQSQKLDRSTAPGTDHVVLGCILCSSLSRKSTNRQLWARCILHADLKFLMRNKPAKLHKSTSATVDLPNHAVTAVSTIVSADWVIIESIAYRLRQKRIAFETAPYMHLTKACTSDSSRFHAECATDKFDWRRCDGQVALALWRHVSRCFSRQRSITRRQLSRWDKHKKLIRQTTYST